MAPGFALADTVPDVVARSEFTTTSVGADGKFHSAVSSEPVNFQDDSGDWTPIDTSLRGDADGSVHPAAVDGDITIPETLARSVVLEHDGNRASLRLIGAHGSRTTDDSTAEFDNALAAVDVDYVSRPDGVKETLTLQSSLAPRVFSYALHTPAGWAAAVESGDVVLRDGNGAEQYRVAAPIAWDGAADPSYTNNLALAISPVSDGLWTLTLTPDAAWLNDPLRQYPVSVDPDFSWANGTTHFHGAQDCYLASIQQANTSFCAQTYLQTGYFNRAYRSLFKFDIAAAIPSAATVSAATFKAYGPPQSVHPAASHSLHTVTSDWDSGATWNQRKAGVPWTTAGGDVSTAASLTSSSVSVQGSSAWYAWTAPLSTVQGWVNGTLPNYGFQLSTDPSAPTGNAYVWASTEASTSSQFPADSTQWPTLDVTWTSGTDTHAPTAIAVSGALSEDGSNSAGSGTASFSVSAHDDLSGVARFDLLDGATTLATANVSCPSGHCPIDATATLSPALAGLSEGVHALKVRATDQAGNAALTGSWKIYVDRTGPTIPPAPTPGPDDGDLNGLTVNAADGIAVAEWQEGDDPALADGSSGSGAATYLVRYRTSPSAAWSAWATVSDTEYTMPTTAASIQLQIAAIDEVGNEGPTAAITATPYGQDPQPVDANDPTIEPTVVSDEDFVEWPDNAGIDAPAAAGASSLARRSAIEKGFTDDNFVYPRTGPINTNFQCKPGAWSPIQSRATFFVIGTCAPGTNLHGFRAKTYTRHPGAKRPDNNEGRSWAAVAPPSTSGFKGCGWMSIFKRLDTSGTASSPSSCTVYNRNLGEFIHASDGTIQPGVPPISAKALKRHLQIWATVNGDGKELDGAPYTVPAGRECRAYGNINPWKKKNNPVLDPITVGGAPYYADGGQLVRIRYLSRYRANDPVPVENAPRNDVNVFWVMTHTENPAAPWVWLSEKCLFGPAQSNT